MGPIEPIGDPSYTGKRRLCLHHFYWNDVQYLAKLCSVCEKLIICCLKMVAIDSKSFCCCMQSDLHVISLSWNYSGRDISRSNFFDIS